MDHHDRSQQSPDEFVECHHGPDAGYHPSKCPWQRHSVHIAIFPCPTWNTGNVAWCGDADPDHGIELYQANADTSYLVFDQYAPYNKTLGIGYKIPYAVVPTITVKQKPVYTFNNDLVYGQIGSEVTILQNCLAYLGYFNLAPTGAYLALTASAVLQFQHDHGINPTSENHVGPLTRAILNSIFSAPNGCIKRSYYYGIR